MASVRHYSQSKSPSKTLESQKGEQHRQVIQLAQAEIEELKDSLRYAEFMLAKTKSEKDNSEKFQLIQEREANRAKLELEQKEFQRFEAVKDAEVYRGQALHSQLNVQKVQDLARDKLQMLSGEVSMKESEVSSLKLVLKEKIDHIAKVEVTEQCERRENRDLYDEIVRKNRTITDLQKELDETQKKLDDVVMGRKAEGTALLEIEHYKTDNERLLNMLGSTKEFAEFGKIAADLGTVRYMDPDRQPDKCHPKKKSTLKNFNPANEMEDWIPEEAYKVAHDFRNKCATQVQQSLMNQLLSDLNKIWRQREKKQIQRIQNDCQREVKFLRRQLACQKPYDQVMNESDIKRLKREVRDNKQALRENVAVIQESSLGPMHGLVLVDQTVKYTNQIQQERRRLVEENEDLKQKIMSLEKASKEGDNDRDKFYEGALWLAKQAVGECEEGTKRFQSLRVEYLKKLVDAGKDDFLRQRCGDWLIEAAERINRETRDKNQELLESALRNKSVHSNRIYSVK